LQLQVSVQQPQLSPKVPVQARFQPQVLQPLVQEQQAFSATVSPDEA
jgi:hypothetical protein